MKINLFLTSVSCRFAAFSSTVNAHVADTSMTSDWLLRSLANDERLLCVSFGSCQIACS